MFTSHYIEWDVLIACIYTIFWTISRSNIDVLRCRSLYFFECLISCCFISQQLFPLFFFFNLDLKCCEALSGRDEETARFASIL